MYFCRPCRAGRQGFASLIGYAFTAGPIVLLVYNCVAISFNDWNLFGGPAVAAPPEGDASAPTLGVGAPLLAYAGIAVLVHITSDVLASIQSSFLDNP